MKDQNVYLQHIVDSIEKISDYIGTGEAEFLAKSMIQDAVIRNLEIIGEAAKRITDETRQINDSIPWKRLAGLRDILIHQYDGVDLGQVWRIAETVLPGIRVQIQAILNNDKLK